MVIVVPLFLDINVLVWFGVDDDDIIFVLLAEMNLFYFFVLLEHFLRQFL